MEDVVLEKYQWKTKRHSTKPIAEDTEAHFEKMVAAEVRAIPEPFQHSQMLMKAGEQVQQQPLQIHEIMNY